MHEHPQLTLALETAPATSFDSFHVDEQNRLAREAVRAFTGGELEDVQLYLWGESGTGKSHLLSAACDAYNQRGFRIAYLPGELINQAGAVVGMEHLDLICVDDLQRLDHAAEIDLFHLINRCREASTHLILAADRAPDELGLALPDLRTRLGWGLVFQLKPLSDQGLHEAFQKEIEHRALQASDEVMSYVLKRFPRRMSILKYVVDKLDEASLLEQRPITVPFVKLVFDEAERMALTTRTR